MQRCARIGIGLTVDDFGTGYSSLSYLKRFPVQKLKIDKSLRARRGPRTSDSAAICRSVIALGHNLGLNLVAEGVEERADLQWLQGHHCDYVQGFLISTPLPLADLQRWAAASNR
jgi:EAL domain-containing protein (putative c-di-GMP-specific phosphodiesterase class I)